MNQKILAALALVCLFGACKSAKKETTSGYEDGLTKYLSSTIEKDSLINPPAQYYKRTIPANEITKYQTLLWSSWKKANAERLKTWAQLSDNSTKDSLIWQLPDQKKMLFSMSKKGNRPDGGYPLYINLHGGGCFPDESGPWTSPSNDSEWKAAKSLGAKYQDSPSMYFIPRMPDDRRGRWYHRAAIAAWIRTWQLAVLSGDINADKTYIMGISEGGYGSFRMGVFLADYFAGAGPMAGPVWADQEPIENLRNTAFHIEVGEKDYAYGRVQNGRDWKKLLDSAAAKNPGQFKHEVEIQNGRGHGIDYFRTAPWLKQFTRKAYPDTLSMVYYAQVDSIYGGEPNVPSTYRKGFGYLRLDGLSKTGERKFYIEKKGNTYQVSSSNVKGKVKGKVKLYIDKVDFSQPILVYYNSKLISNKKLKPNVGTMTESLALFGDPERLFPVAVDILIE